MHIETLKQNSFSSTKLIEFAQLCRSHFDQMKYNRIPWFLRNYRSEPRIYDNCNFLTLWSNQLSTYKCDISQCTKWNQLNSKTNYNLTRTDDERSRISDRRLFVTSALIREGERTRWSPRVREGWPMPKNIR